MNRNTRRGFTVVEMMVVVGIFIVLIGLVIPATSKVRQSAMRTQCLTQMRGLQLAHLAYMNDHHGRFVPVGQTMAHSGLTDEQLEQEELPIWYFMLQEYYDTRLVLKSPLDDSKHWPASMGGGDVPVNGSSFRRTSYGMNDYLMPHNPAAAVNDDPENKFERLSQIRSPANTVNFLIITFEGDNAGSDHMHPENWMFNPFLPVEQLAANFIQTNAHGGAEKTWDARSGYSFLDGHVATHPFSTIVRPKESDTYNKFNPRSAVAFTADLFMNQ